METLISARTMRGERVCLAGLLVFAFACGGSGEPAGPAAETPPPPPPPAPAGKDQLSIVSGSGVSDTIQARLSQALVVEVRVKGELRAGVDVKFAALPPTDSTRDLENMALVGRVGDDQFASSFTTPTEADGRVRASVALGTVAADARIAVTVPSLGLSDTARFVVRPGAPDSLLLPVRDTALMANARYTLGAVALDRFGNRIAGATTFASANALGTVDAGGNVQLSSTVGRGRIIVRAGALVDSAGFVVVPPDLVTLTRAGAVMSIRLDGSGKTMWPAVRPYYGGILSPKGDMLAFWDGDASQSSIYITAPSDTTRRLVPASQLTMAFEPRFSPDGAWVFFNTNAIWRIRSDGTQLEQVATPSAGSLYGLRDPSVSPDGGQVVYLDADAQTLVIRDLATGQQRTIAPAPGDHPLFSPDGTRLAYDMGGAVGVMNADGTGRTYLGCPASSCTFAGWTKDSQSLLAQAFDWVAMVSVTTHEWILIPRTNGSYAISVQ